jgi:hypothetical protein
MGRTIPSAAMQFVQEQESFARFRRALRREDQLVLDHLFSYAHQHLAAAAYAAHSLPFEIYLLAMLLEEHKQMMQMMSRMERILPLLEQLDLLA